MKTRCAAGVRPGATEQAQAAGRGGLFADYRLRVAHVVRDYGLNDREQVPR